MDTSRTTAAAAASNSGSTNELKYKGVRKRKWGKYVSEIRLPNSRERIWLGSFDTGEKAARAFDAALFCLRGPTAKFNFPDDPPNLAGCHRLTPAEIQGVAQHYASTCQPRTPPPPSSSNSEAGGAGPIDWSFLDVLDSDTAGNAGHVSDFGLFHDPVDDMYMPPHLVEDDEDNNGDYNENGNGNYNYNVPSNFLWNF